MSAVKFNTSNLNETTFDLYQVNDFNGVDYTTTPTKVDDSRAIEMSNYLPEGKTLAKRYGYDKVMSIFDVGEITYNNQTYTIEDTTNEFRVVEYKDYLIVFIGREIEQGIYETYIKFYNKSDLSLKAQYYANWYSTLSNTVLGYKCSKTPIFIIDDKIYAFVFNDYYIIGLYTLGNLERFYIDKLSVGKKFVESGTNNFDLVDAAAPYIPTLALNYQPKGSTSKSIDYEQLNMLSPYFYLEFFVTFKAIRTNNQITDWEIENPSYDIQTLMESATLVSNQTFDIRLTDTSSLNGNTGFKLSTAMDGGIVTLSMDTHTVGGTTTKYYDIPEKTVVAMQNNQPIYSYPNVAEVKGDYATVKLKVQFNKGFDNSSEIFNCSNGITYGVNNSADRIFVSNKNVDYHTLDSNGKPDYTYFGDTTYTAVGSSASDIIGYQILNDGSMAIFKDDKDATNVFIRTGRINTSVEQYQVYDYINETQVNYDYLKSEEIYKVISSGLLIKSLNKDTKFCLYDNKLIFNTTYGVYYLNLNNTTSSQSYSSKELSYYIRNDLGTNIDNSSIIVYKDRLYVARENKEGEMRVYVADKNRYSFINSELQYEWWCLDNIPVFSFFSYDDELLFIDKYFNMYKFNEGQFYDVIEYKTNSAKFAEQLVDTELAFDYSYEGMIVSPTSETWNKLYNMWTFNSYLDKRDLGVMTKLIKDYVSLKFTRSVYMDLVDSGFYWRIDETQGMKLIFTIGTYRQKEHLDFITKMISNNLPLYINNPDYNDDDGSIYNKYKYKADESLDIEYESDDTITYTVSLEIDSIGYSIGSQEQSRNVLLDISGQELKINTMYQIDGNEFNVLDYEYVIGKGWCDEYGDVVGTAKPRLIDFTLFDIPVNFYDGMDRVNTYEAVFVVKMPVFSVWCSKFTNFNSIDVLKSTRSIHFTPETRRGGYTSVGYRIMRKTGDFVNENYKAVLRDVYYNTSFASKGFNFENIDFGNVDFRGEAFGRSYSATKKIKHFEYLQIRMYNDNFYDSSISQLAIRYMYSRNNRGVK